MTAKINSYNYLALLEYLNADRIVEVRLVKSTYLVRFERKLLKFALFVKRSIVEQPLDLDSIEGFCKFINRKLTGTRLEITYNLVAKKFVISNTVSLVCYSWLSYEQLKLINLTLTLDGLAIFAKPRNTKRLVSAYLNI